MLSINSRRLVIIVVVFVVIVVGLLSTFIWYKSSKDKVDITPVVVVTDPQYKIIGSSVEGRKIEAYTYGKGKNHLVFVGGIHGGYEWNSVYLAYRFIDYLTANPTFISENFKITVIPSANPDGMVKVVGREGRFTVADVPSDPALTTVGRFNANKVDLNRNFDCKWQPGATWRGNAVSAGTKAFSEPEAVAIRDFALENKPSAFIFWHSQAGAVYASECLNGILPNTLSIMDAYAKAAGYNSVKSFNAYPVTGDAEGWLASVGIPAITVELTTHDLIEWDKNIAGVKALVDYYSNL